MVRAEAFPHVKRPDRLRSLNSLAIGILRHQNGRWSEWTHIRRRQVRPLALTAVLSYSSRQPQDTPPNFPLWLERRPPIPWVPPLASATLISIDAKHK